MHDHETQEPSEESLAKGYEQEDIALPTVFRWAGILIVFTVIVSSIVVGIYYFCVPNHAARSGYTVNEGRQMGANVPVIQEKPMLDIEKLRTDEYQAENEFAYWQDDDHKMVLRIKLSRAMEIIKQRGVLPSAGPAPKMGTNNAPTAPVDMTAPSGTPSNVTPVPSTPMTLPGGTAPQQTPSNATPLPVDPTTNGTVSPQGTAPTGTTVPSTPITPSGQ